MAMLVITKGYLKQFETTSRTRLDNQLPAIDMDEVEKIQHPRSDPLGGFPRAHIFNIKIPNSTAYAIHNIS